MADMLESPFSPEPQFLRRTEFDAFLRWCVANDVSDVMLKSDDPLAISRFGRIQHVTRRPLKYEELTQLLMAIDTDTASARLKSGEEINFRYSLPTERRTVRLGFRGCATQCQGRGASEGMEIVVRTIPATPPTPDQLGLEAPILEASYTNKNGLILVTGPTGSGKSTTLMSIIGEILKDDAGKHVLTYEAPIEFDMGQVPNKTGIIAQTEIPGHLRGGFAKGISNALRRKPDVILVGEARDPETIAGSVTACQTGHLVFTTTHTNNVAMTIPRMIDEFPAGERWSMAIKIIDACRGIVNQQLFPSTDGKRVALREYLIFDEGIRERLIAAGEIGFQPQMAKEVREHGRTLLAHAEMRQAEGSLDPKFVEAVRAQSGGSVKVVEQEVAA